MTWIRLDCKIDMSPNFLKLDGFGRALYILLLRLAKNKEGVIDRDYWDLDYLINMLGFSENEKEKIQSAMSKISNPRLKLLEKFEDTEDFYITNWDQYQKPRDNTNAERQRRYRENKKSNDTVTDSNDTVTPLLSVTPLRITHNGVHDMTGQLHDNTENIYMVKKQPQGQQDLVTLASDHIYLKNNKGDNISNAVTIDKQETLPLLAKEDLAGKETGLQESNRTPKKIKIKEEYPADFEKIWMKYPVEGRKAKQAARDAYNRARKLSNWPGVAKILESIESQQKSKERLRAQKEFAPNFPYLQKWLKSGSWEDETEQQQREKYVYERPFPKE